ncbi:MAG: FAD-binding protein [Coriobacteriia bacterium]
MNGKSITDGRSLGRRDFLKGAAVAGATAAFATVLPGCTTQDEGSGATSSGAAAVSPEGYVCSSDWLGKAPVIDDADITETITVDVVVCGGGHAGTQAACAAAQAGSTVAVIEMQPEDSYTYKGDDICSYNSKLLTEWGFGPYDTGEIVDEYVRRNAGRCQPEIIRLFVENSGEMMDNMVSLVPDTSTLFDREGGQCIVQIAYNAPDGSYYPYELNGYKSWATTVQTIGTTNPTPVNGREKLSRLTEIETYVMLEAIDKGAKWYWEHTATVLVQDADGAVTGAIAKAADGKYKKFMANKGVILATGDLGTNVDMIWELCSEIGEMAARAGQKRDTVAARSTSAGQGQKMGCWAGGYMETHPRPTMSMGGGGGGPWGTAPFLWLNSKGKRFMNEASFAASYPVSKRQPLGNICTITDSKWMQTVQRAGLDHGAPNWGAPQSFMDNLVSQMGQVLGTGAKGFEVGGVAIINVTMQMGSVVYAGETLEELLGYLDYKGEALQAALDSIEAYNALCAVGSDTQFGKDPKVMIPVNEGPFYGCKSANDGTVSAGLVTLTGLLTDDSLNVLGQDGTTPIKGLYATGNCLGGRYGNSYCTPSAGNSMGQAMTHGRVVGKIVAAL